MTRVKWAKMSDDEKRVKIAELCGWEHSIVGNFPWQMIPPGCSSNNVISCPDYMRDLNAMHNALLDAHANDEHFVEKWLWYLAEVVSKGDTHDYAEVGKWELINATASQRAESFALTMEPE